MEPMSAVDFAAPSGALAALDSALDALSAEFLPTIDRDQLGARCVSLQNARQRLDAIIATGIAEAERAGVAVVAGQRTMAQYLASRTHASPDALRADTRLGLWVGQFTQLETAMLDGGLSRQHVDLLRRTDSIRVHMAMQRDQAMFIDFAQVLEWKSFQNCVKYWLLVNDPDGAEPDDHDTKNTLSISTQANGRVTINGDLDPLTGAILKQAIGNEENQLFDQDNENGTVRTATQRRANALGNLIERGAGRTETNSKPLIHVVMSLNVLQHALAQLAKDPSEQDFVSDFVRTSLLAPGGQNAIRVPQVVCIRTNRAPRARGERSSRSDHADHRGSRPAVSRCSR